MVCGTVPSGCTKGRGSDGCDEEGEEIVGFLEGSTGARALEGCCRMLISSSTNRLDANGATPGRVTVHCWSNVALLRDYGYQHLFGT